MSSSSLYKVYKTKVVCVTSLKNSWGTAPPLWGWLGMTYLGWDSPHTIGRNMEALWRLETDKRVPLELRLCHAFTFDYAVVGKAYTERMATACGAAYRLLDVWPEASGWSNHWGALSEFFKTVKLDKRCLGVGLGCTSVCDEWSEYRSAKKVRERVFDCAAEILENN